MRRLRIRQLAVVVPVVFGVALMWMLPQLSMNYIWYTQYRHCAQVYCAKLPNKPLISAHIFSTLGVWPGDNETHIIFVDYLGRRIEETVKGEPIYQAASAGQYSESGPLLSVLFELRSGDNCKYDFFYSAVDGSVRKQYSFLPQQ